MLKVLVTGGGGQLAQCIKSVAGLYPKLKFTYKTSSELDITNKDEVESTFNFQAFDYCINCAAYTNVDKAESEKELAYKINVLGPKYLAETCSKHQVTLIHVSTDFVFDGNASKPYKETDSTNPIGVYGKTKLEGEQQIINTIKNHFIIRTSWLYSEFGNNFLKTMLRLADQRDELGVVGDQIGSPTYAIDLAVVIVELIESKNNAYGVYHYSNKGVISWYDFAKEIFRLNQSNIQLNKIGTKDYPTPAKRPKYSVLDTSKISQILDKKTLNWKDSLVVAISKL
ncbi:dTDP-4-dehydrorhamnose reductase [Winogradskyella endarachnes]|uniref:dTDP-4-dehydrorhamnose reductase n=1 Tax=Winogradskyella endarachnes TaxID=2681965 RepID=A0A6L6UE15_9FLAO|nr:dTDP-4-dehydrorhamnose reductase [Winogradskyella endarachnes]MUU79067.1 dTDP-4-dehydrorhamnose reductase [Winogradskyella endarachnes]